MDIVANTSITVGSWKALSTIQQVGNGKKTHSLPSEMMNNKWVKETQRKIWKNKQKGGNRYTYLQVHPRLRKSIPTCKNHVLRNLGAARLGDFSFFDNFL